LKFEENYDFAYIRDKDTSVQVMKYIHYLDYIRGLPDTTEAPPALKADLQSTIENESAQREILFGLNLENLQAEVRQLSPQEKDILIDEQIATINRLAKLNSELQIANAQLALNLTEKKKPWLAQET
jgi:hypothetical protein